MSDKQSKTAPSPGPVERRGDVLTAFPQHQAPPTSYLGFPWADSTDASLSAQLQPNYDSSGFPEFFRRQLSTGKPGRSSVQETRSIPTHPAQTVVPVMAPIDPYATPSNEHQGIPTQSLSKENHRPNQQRLAEIEQEEDQIRDARDDLLGSRFQLKDQRKEIRDLRQQTGREEGVVVSQIRKLLRERNIEFPVELETAFARVTGLRDDLGSLEGRYEEDEGKYDDMEWKYTQKEAEFVVKLTGGDDIPLVEERDAETDGLIMYGFIPGETGTLPMESQELRPKTIDIPTFDDQQSLEGMEGFSHILKQPSSSSTPRDNRPTNSYLESEHESRQFAEVFSPLPQVNRVTAISRAHLAWNDTKKRIDKWILGTVNCSRYQKSIVRSMLSEDDLNWLVTQYWNSDSPSTPPAGMNAEDSYLSRDTVNLSIPSVPVSVLSDKADIERPKVENALLASSTPHAMGVPTVQSKNPPTIVALDEMLHPTSDNRQAEALDVKESGASLFDPSNPLGKQPEGVIDPQPILSLEQSPKEDQSYTPTISDVFETKTERHYEEDIVPQPFISVNKSNDSEDNLPIPIATQGQHNEDKPTNTIAHKMKIVEVPGFGNNLHHFRTHSSPEPRHLTRSDHRPSQRRPYEDPSSVCRPYSPEIEGALLSPLLYEIRPNTPPKTRSPSPYSQQRTRRLSMDNRAPRAPD
ncbi:hypothetical protein K505DRAFT_361042 [Melanomma pulvis-pyrius CBS 109.77]|uniref:Uncharacterized protein n=1 Tax=Melanomma pulvis-pyrius CBS 109.77 TaxID=1314802 RepID=A0A6A6XDF1_9PLEO|nr:hypothetical protein K505DRAFT_361042 [Melanomma pulvis-pyrius CBS 109.77]